MDIPLALTSQDHLSEALASAGLHCVEVDIRSDNALWAVKLTI